MGKELAYSLDESIFMDKEDVIDQLDGDEKIVYVGEQVKKFHSDFINVNSILGDIAERATESGGEFSDSYSDELFGLNKDKKEMLKVLISDYLKGVINEPSFYEIKNVKEISIEAFLGEIK